MEIPTSESYLADSSAIHARSKRDANLDQKSRIG